MGLFHKPSRPDPAIQHSDDIQSLSDAIVELRNDRDHLAERLSAAVATIECQATELAEHKKRLGGIEWYDVKSMHKRLDIHESGRTGSDRDIRSLQEATDQLTANQKALADRLKIAEDRLSIQIGIIQAAELATAAVRDETANTRNMLDTTDTAVSALAARFSTLETTVGRLRSERDSRLKDAIRVLSGEATILVAHPVSNSVKVINRDTGEIRDTPIP